MTVETFMHAIRDISSSGWNHEDSCSTDHGFYWLAMLVHEWVLVTLPIVDSARELKKSIGLRIVLFQSVQIRH